MKIYVAGHSQPDAIKVAELLRLAGHEITSTWIDEDFSRTASYTDEQKRHIADKEAAEVSKSDCLVILASAYRVTGGKFVEAGIALGLQKRVVVLGHRENMLMWHSSVERYDSVEAFIG